MAVKTNPPTLHEICTETMQWAIEQDVTTLGGDDTRSSEVSGGIEELREVWSVPAPADLEDLELWRALQSLILVKREVIDRRPEPPQARKYPEGEHPRKTKDRPMGPRLPAQSPGAMNVTHAYALPEQPLSIVPGGISAIPRSRE